MTLGESLGNPFGDGVWADDDDLARCDALLDRLGRRAAGPADLDDPVAAALAALITDVDGPAVPRSSVSRPVVARPVRRGRRGRERQVRVLRLGPALGAAAVTALVFAGGVMTIAQSAGGGNQEVTTVDPGSSPSATPSDPRTHTDGAAHRTAPAGSKGVPGPGGSTSRETAVTGVAPSARIGTATSDGLGRPGTAQFTSSTTPPSTTPPSTTPPSTTLGASPAGATPPARERPSVTTSTVAGRVESGQATTGTAATTRRPAGLAADGSSSAAAGTQAGVSLLLAPGVSATGVPPLIAAPTVAGGVTVQGTEPGKERSTRGSGSAVTGRDGTRQTLRTRSRVA